MHSFIKIMAFVAAITFLSVSPVSAKNTDNQGKNNSQGKSQDNNQGNNKSDKNSSSKHNSKEMHYAGISQKDAKKYAKQYQFYGYKPLPPGIRKNMARGKPIPPGLAYNRVPAPYLATLPRYNGYEWRGYGSDLVLVSIVSNVIADVIVDALN